MKEERGVDRDPREINSSTASGALPAVCETCSAGDAILLSPEQACTVTGIPARLIYRWVEAGSIHYKEAANGKLTVCVKTLLLAGKRS